MTTTTISVSGSDEPLSSSKETKVDFNKERRLVQVKWVLFVGLTVLLSDLLLYEGGPAMGWGIWSFIMAWTLPFCRSKSKNHYFIPSIAISFLSFRMCMGASWSAGVLSALLLFIVASSGRLHLMQLPEALERVVVSILSRLKLFCCIPVVLSQRYNKALFAEKLNQVSWVYWLMPLFLFLVFLNFFRLANPILEQVYVEVEEVIFKFFDKGSMWKIGTLRRLIFWLIVGWLSCAALVPVIFKRSLSSMVLEGFKDSNLRLPESVNKGVLALNSLWMLNLAFLLSNSLDVYYLWVGGNLPEGVKYVEYAHRGVFWLTLCVLTSTLFFIFFMPKGFSSCSTWLKGLSMAWVIQNLMVGFGAMKRLELYVDFNGLTQLRVVGFVGIGCVIACLLIVVYAVQCSKGGIWVLRRQALVMAVFLYGMVIIPRDSYIAEYNVKRILSGKNELSVQILAQSWGSGACVELIPLLDGEQKDIRRGTAALLLYRLKDFQKELRVRKKDWRKQDWSFENNVKVLEGYEEKCKLIVGSIPLERHLNELRSFSRQWY